MTSFTPQQKGKIMNKRVPIGHQMQQITPNRSEPHCTLIIHELMRCTSNTFLGSSPYVIPKKSPSSGERGPQSEPCSAGAMSYKRSLIANGLITRCRISLYFVYSNAMLRSADNTPMEVRLNCHLVPKLTPYSCSLFGLRHCVL